ncbi:MAG: glutamine--fructose-6-phosphate transaminase (isomerizing), partial [Gaiellaceae bacterium]
RWATHGGVTEANAHPLCACDARKLAIVLNGIVENYRELRNELLERGHTFVSETDAEVVAHLLEDAYDGDLVEAMRTVYARIEGHFTIVVIHHDHPNHLVGVRHQTPMVVGLGDGENFVASNLAAFLAETRNVQFPDDGEIASITPDGVAFVDATTGLPVEHEIVAVDWDDHAAERSGYETFMLKEIYEQPEGVAETIGDRVRHRHLVLEGLGLSEDELSAVRRIVIVACGTSYHAGLIGRYAIEEWARVPVEMDIASEYRYRNPVVGPGDLVIGITQSGETADTLAAMRLAREAGARVLTVTNIMGSQATRDADAVLYTRAGLEIGVAATKTFLAQVAAMYLLGLRIAELRGSLSSTRIVELVAELKELPSKIEATLAAVEDQVRAVAATHGEQSFFLYLGRHIGLPVCLEGALKLKEISYIPTDAYAAGEMKHGPIALLDESTPVVCVATDSPVLEKVLSNVEEVRARGAQTIAVATVGGERAGEVADETIEVARTDWILQPVVAILPL